MVTTWYASSFERLQRLTDDSHKSLSLRRMGSYYCHPHVLLCRSPLAWSVSTPFRAAEASALARSRRLEATDAVVPAARQGFARKKDVIAKGKRPHTVGTSPTPAGPVTLSPKSTRSRVRTRYTPTCSRATVGLWHTSTQLVAGPRLQQSSPPASRILTLSSRGRACAPRASPLPLFPLTHWHGR